MFPLAIGVRVSPRNAPFKVIVPGELCDVLPGQLFKKKLPDVFTGEMVKFAAMRPSDRLDKIKAAVTIWILFTVNVKAQLVLSSLIC